MKAEGKLNNKHLEDDGIITLEDLNSLASKSLYIHSHFDLLLWLQGDIQQYIPHKMMIAAWGDFSSGALHIDVVSPLPGLRTVKVATENLTGLFSNLFKYWENNAKSPFSLNMDKGLFNNQTLNCSDTRAQLQKMKLALVHGIKDLRGGQDCLYVFIDTAEKMPIRARKMASVLLPYIDSALRQLEHLPEQLHREPTAGELASLLSSRESEIMDWVKRGKTNQDIGMILNISAFTVKNHLQRIFKKLDVLNRAQAVNEYTRTFQA
jgi:transcriptional regulator EpsA